MTEMQVYIEKFSDYQLGQIEDFFRRKLNEINFWNHIENKKTILIKPNLLGAYLPERAVTTHPVIIEAMIKLLQEKGKEVWLGDSPGGTVFVEKIWQETGIAAICKKYSVRLINFSETGVDEHESSLGIRTTKAFWEADAVINIPKYKTHSLMYYTGAIKNLYGLIPGLKKSDFHKTHPQNNDFAKVLIELYRISKEKLVLNILDGIWGMEGEGPSAGIPRNFQVVMLSNSASALDFIASKMLGFKELQLSYIMACMKLDNLNPSEIKVPEKWMNFQFSNVKIKRVNLFVRVLSHSPRFLRLYFQKYFAYFPDFKDTCKLCMVCKNSCPVKAISYNKKNNKLEINHQICIKCMCCHELCPHQAVYIKKSFLAKFIIK
jgi:uncharacterized protein (DUF362 family)/NAD-dependent dihydropyrimidine dehydrogenase PreA subunit